MPSGKKSKTKKQYHFLFMSVLILLAVFFLYQEFGREDIQPGISQPVHPRERPGESLPNIAIVIGGLGPNKETAEKILGIHARLTISIAPYETFTRWIAEEAYRNGHDVIGHIPMEAKKPHTLGKGGLYVWMTDNEIRETIKNAIHSIPHIKGISSNMGSAFTEDERTMNILLSVLREHSLFFLDSFTTPYSVSFRIGKELGIPVLKRDMFIDQTDSPDDRENRWKKLVNIAGKNGYAIALVHPRTNTFEFLKKMLSRTDVTVVPLSKLTASVRNKGASPD